MRVQISQESKMMLEAAGGYKIQEKGIVKLPGRKYLYLSISYIFLSVCLSTFLCSSLNFFLSQKIYNGKM